MAHNVIEFDQKCKPCKGTGLYVGMGERDGGAVVCHTCKGTGCHHVKIEYDDFEKREINPSVKHVYETNPGISIGQGNGYLLKDFGGMRYEDWLSDKPFPQGSENRKFTCPAWWYQCANYKLKPEWDSCVGCGSFSSCDNFSNKESCWQRFDSEHGGKKNNKEAVEQPATNQGQNA